ncbi:MAG: AAA family ATPase [Eubacterium sp.]|nr:AAA family ATPase [Eubacterium sp.]
MNNIFVVGPEVKGESQIGYERYLDKFTDILLNTINNISITGLKRFGKTSLAKEVIERVKKKADGQVITIFINLAKQKSFSDLLVSIINMLEDEIIEADAVNIFENNIYNRYIEKLSKIEPESKTYRDTFDSIFKWISKQGYRTILMIDEFDSASDLFTDTADFEFLRDLSSNRDIGVSLVLVSRRQLYMIEKKNFNNSTFHGVVQTYPIDGFDESDMTKFYGALKEKYGIELSTHSKQRLHYYCGRSPYLLSMFAYSIVDDYSKTGNYSIDAIYRNREIDIENYYKSIFACLNNDKISVDGAYEEICTIEKLVGVIIGPKIGIVEEDINLLENMGYLYSEKDMYKSISGHFTNALRRVPLSVDTWNVVLAVEKKIKAMIRKQVMINNNVEYIDYDLWSQIFDNIGATGTLDTYDKFIDDSMQEYKCEVDLLDVCSLDVAVSIIQFYWETWFSKFFNHDSWDKWEYKLRLCASARNPMAHGHEEFLSSESKSSVNEYCETILKLLSKSNACLDTNTELRLADNIQKSNVRRLYYSQIYDLVDSSLVNTTAKMMAAELNNKGIRGYFSINDKKYKCTVGKSKWTSKYPGTSLSTHLGKEFEIRITLVNVAQGSLTVDLI